MTVVRRGFLFCSFTCSALSTAFLCVALHCFREKTEFIAERRVDKGFACLHRREMQKSLRSGKKVCTAEGDVDILVKVVTRMIVHP